jgi:hypothetical protein
MAKGGKAGQGNKPINWHPTDQNLEDLKKLEQDIQRSVAICAPRSRMLPPSFRDVSAKFSRTTSSAGSSIRRKYIRRAASGESTGGCLRNARYHAQRCSLQAQQA